MTGKFETIIWDWNGTLLDDTDFCIRSMNRLLSVRGLPELSKERYLEVFDFPVEKYYRSIGFEFSV
jgi:phosphoglycolate phosphatase